MLLVIGEYIISQKECIYSQSLNIYFIKVFSICNIKIYDYYKLYKKIFFKI